MTCTHLSPAYLLSNKAAKVPPPSQFLGPLTPRTSFSFTKEAPETQELSLQGVKPGSILPGHAVSIDSFYFKERSFEHLLSVMPTRKA